MKICGIVAEYNPFHKGHAYQIETARKAGVTHVMAVMSGNFVQRGEPAVAEKHLRAKLALSSGADLVIELPLPYALSSAECFARGAVSLMQRSGCVDVISFGAENTRQELKPVLDALLSPGFDAVLQKELKKGDSFAAARTRAVAQMAGADAAALLTRPNNILAVEYQKAASKLGFAAEFLAVPRKGAAHDSQDGEEEFCSASLIRDRIGKGDLSAAEKGMPEGAFSGLSQAIAAGEAPASPERLENAVLAALRRRSIEELAQLPDISEGLENRFYGAIRQATSLEELYRMTQSKRYPQARVRRMVWQSFLGVTAQMQKTEPPYIRVLGMNRKGEEILREIKEKGSLPVSPSLLRLAETSPEAKLFADLEAAAADQYVLGLPKVLPCGYDLTCPVVKG